MLQGVTVFPDWFNPKTGDYWNGEFQNFFSPETGIDIDGVWIVSYGCRLFVTMF